MSSALQPLPFFEVLALPIPAVLTSPSSPVAFRKSRRCGRRTVTFIFRECNHEDVDSGNHVGYDNKVTLFMIVRLRHGKANPKLTEIREA